MISMIDDDKCRYGEAAMAEVWAKSIACTGAVKDVTVTVFIEILDLCPTQGFVIPQRFSWRLNIS